MTQDMRHGQSSEGKQNGAKQGRSFKFIKNYVNLFFCQMLNAKES